MSRQMTLQDGDYFELPWGRVEFHNNEIHIRTTINDAAGLSFIGATNCKVSWKTDGGEEKALLELRQNGKADGEFYFGAFQMATFIREVARGNPRALDAAMLELVTINPDLVEFRVPVKFSAGAIGGAGVSDTMWSNDGRFFLQLQGADGNLVKYRASAPFSKDDAVPEWASGPSLGV